MPVATRSTFDTTGQDQANPMAADYQSRSTSNESPAPDEQEKPQQERAPLTPEARRVQQELSAVEAEIASLRTVEKALKESRKAGTPRSLSQLAREIARNAKKSPLPTPPPRPRLDDTPPSRTPTEDLGTAIGASVKAAIDTLKAEERRGSFIPKAEAKQIACDLSKPKRAEFKSTMFTRGIHADPRVQELMSINWASPAELQVALGAITGGKDLDLRLATTIYESMAPKETSSIVALLMKETAEDPSMAVSGLRMLRWIDEQGTKNPTATKHKALKAEFDATVFLKAGIPEEDNLVACMELVDAINALPARYTVSPLDKHELILGKIPAHLQTEHWVQQLKNELDRAVRKGAEPWTVDALCEEISENLETADATPSANAAATTKNSPKDDGGARARRNEGKTLTGAMGKWLSDGKFSFITIDGDSSGDVFCHQSSIVGSKPDKGDKVTFKIVHKAVKEGSKSREFAVDVRKASPTAVNTPTANTATQADDDDDDESDSGTEIAPSASCASFTATPWAITHP